MNLSEAPHPPQSQYVTQKNGIPKERITNIDKIAIIEDLVKCSICLEIICKPFECEVCGSLFCEDCINDWLKVNMSCPMKCQNFKMNKARPNTRKMLNLIKMKCINFPECSVVCDYWEMLEHEKSCKHKKIHCPSDGCEFTGCYKELKEHIVKNCPYNNVECGFCKIRLPKTNFGEHLEEHKKKRNFYLGNCSECSRVDDNLIRCICGKTLCYFCLTNGKNRNCMHNCYVFDSGLPYTNQTYNISKYPLPRNFEVKLHYNYVDWVRTGITLDYNIVDDQTDLNCPRFDIYCLLEDLMQFYTLKNGWKNCFHNNSRPLKAGDDLIMRMKNCELRFELNGEDLGSFIKVDLTNKKNIYLLVHARNEKSKCQIVYITEIFN